MPTIDSSYGTQQNPATIESVLKVVDAIQNMGATISVSEGPSQWTTSMVTVTAIVNATAGATTSIVAAPSAKHAIWVYGWELGFDTAGTYQWKSGSTALQQPVPRGANGGSIVMASHPTMPILKCAEAQALQITTVTSVVTGHVVYAIVQTSA